MKKKDTFGWMFTWAKWPTLLVSSWLITLVAAYLIFLKIQYVDLFFESQFLHIDFLKSLSQHHLTAKAVFTIFAEHLFPGYNILLAINYYVFNLWGGFDGLLYLGSLVAATGMVLLVIRRSTDLNFYAKVVVSLISILLLLSTTNNPQWGMALAASVGVSLFLFFLLNLHFLLGGEISLRISLSYCALAFAILFFLGGYAIGAGGAIFILLLLRIYTSRIVGSASISLAIFTLACLLIYAAIVAHYGHLLNNKPVAATFDIGLVARFAILMIGASVIGKAVFEQTDQLWLYYLCGATIFVWCACFFSSVIRRQSKTDLFFAGLAAYSLVNIVVISFFRFRNGLPGALGQWYNVHTHFIAIAVIYHILSINLRELKAWRVLVRVLSILLILLTASSGYYFEWIKAEHIRNWKTRFVSTAPVLLTFPELITDKNDSFNTMLWSYPEARAGLEYLHAQKLWVFGVKDPLIDGLTDDKWILNDRRVIVICPAGSRNLMLQLWRPKEWGNSTVEIKYPDRQERFVIGSEKINALLAEGKPYVLLRSDGASAALPATRGTDSRPLFALVKEVVCS